MIRAKRLNVALLAVLLIVAGCATSASQRLFNARLTYTNALETVNQVYAEGAITQDTLKQIKPYQTAAAAALAAWEAAINAGDDASQTEASNDFKQAVSALRAILDGARKINGHPQ